MDHLSHVKQQYFQLFYNTTVATFARFLFSVYDVPIELFSGRNRAITYCTPKVGAHDYSKNAVASVLLT